MDRIQGSRIHHLKELRPGSAARSEIRVLFAFDPARSALQNIPIAERLYLEYTAEGGE